MSEPGKTASALVRLEDVRKSYRRGAEKVAVLDGLRLEVGEGEFLAIMGPSGSGKTTLLNLLGGLERPDSGTVEIGGVRVDRLPSRKLTPWRGRHVSYVYQMYNLLPALSAERNVEVPLLVSGLSRRARKEHVATALRLVGLWERRKHRPSQLSGGEQQRVGIARAIVTDPTLLVCDEPTGDLDRRSGEAILDLLVALNREQGKTIVMVTHDPRAAARAQRTLFLGEGRLGAEARELAELQELAS